ncbi:MAG: response regulator [Polyangiaceae bacterium]|nr:response regulator [Polyangiaceae bacterium]
MNTQSMTRVLVIDDDPSKAQLLAGFLTSRDYLVETCSGLDHARDVLARWRPHVLVLVPTLEAERHEELEELRRIYPRIPVVVLTLADGPDLIMDVEAFAPALPARPSRGLAHIASAVAAASAMT